MTDNEFENQNNLTDQNTSTGEASDTNDAQMNMFSDANQNTQQQPAQEQAAPYYTNTVVKPKKKKGTNPWMAAVVSCLVTSVVFVGAFAISVPMMKNSIVEDLAENQAKTSTAAPIPATLTADGKNSVAAVSQAVSPSVVSIINKVRPSGMLNRSVEQGSGSGIIISEDGYIVTNNHVIAGANEITVKLSTDEEYTAELIGTDAQTDLAVLKINASGLKAAALGNSNDVQVGEQVIAIGNPLGEQLSGSVTVGYISALNRKIDVEGTTYNLLQTDAAINEGNSGGALVNLNGEVIGINSVKVAASGVEGLGFAIPISDAKPIIDDLIAHGYVTGRPSIGVEVVALNNSIAYYYDLPLNYGLYVNSVQKDSGAEKAGLKNGDIIVGCNGKDVKTLDELNEIRDQFKSGDTITLTIYRDDKKLDVDVTLTESKPENTQKDLSEQAMPQ